jgi:hypothetical protein
MLYYFVYLSGKYYGYELEMGHAVFNRLALNVIV